MNDDIYNPPAAPLVDTAVTTAEFYIVSKKKFLILMIATFGFYQLYWSYQNWKRQKITTGLQVRPLVRTIFQIFFYHSLFRRIDHRLRSNDKKYYWHPDSYATAIVVLTIASNIADRFAAKAEHEIWLQLLSIGFLPLIALAYLPAQDAINLCCDDPKGESNDSLSAKNIVLVIIGTLAWMMVIFGFFVMLTGQGK